MFGRKELENDFEETIIQALSGVFFCISDDQSMAERVLGSREDYRMCSNRPCRKGFNQEYACY